DYTHLGEFAEIFAATLAEKGRARAVLGYWSQVLRSVPGFIANKIYWSLSMLRNYAVISYRTIVKNAGYSLISLLGLAVGLASFILILAYARFETSYDRFHEKADRTFRLIGAEVKPGEKPGEFDAQMPDPAATVLKTEFPEVRHAARVMKQFNDPAVLSFEGKSFMESGLIADQDFLEIFSFPALRGDRSRALDAPGSIVLTERVARKLYGNQDPIGKTLTYGIRGGKGDLTVSAVVRDVPRNSHLQFDYLLSLATIEARKQDAYMFKNWNVGNFTIYAELSDPAAQEPLEGKIAAWMEKNRPESAKAGSRFYLQPLKDIHLRSNIAGELATNNEIRTVSLFLAIAVLILLIAAVNYMNLVTARSSTRAREIGIRKVTGADRRQLVRQFLGESVIFAFMALAAALAIARLALVRFNSVAGVELGFHDLLTPSFFLLVVGTTLFVGLLAGAYPALMLSSFQASKVLKEHTASGRKGSRLRDALVVAQFTASIALLVCALVVSGQLRFVQNQKLGYDREHVVIIPLREPETMAAAAAIKTEFLRLPEIESVSRTSGLPTKIRSRMINQKLVSDQGETIKTNFHFDYIDEDFLKVFKIELAAGRNLAAGEKNGALINETFAKTAGWKGALGKEIDFFEKMSVVGVVKDFYFQSFHSSMAPMALFPNDGNMLAVRTRPGDLPKTIALLKQGFEKISRSQPWDFSFFDEEFDALYRKERRAGQILGAFAFLAVFIACLGLLGLAAFAVERRTKEIGVRKVLGASAPRLALKLSREFVVLVLLANVIAWPVAYFAMSKWLQSFAYRIPLGPGTFILAALGALLVAVLTVSTQTLRAASANPVESLRYE
ncbi:MAG: ABC transporter permease, partial [Candidatus Aminicenantes bacterium]|nr:ABC transporter permease [Candidatus Aminicenantes bacterium]